MEKMYKNKTEEEFESTVIVKIKKSINLHKIYHFIKRLIKKEDYARRRKIRDRGN